MVSCPRSGFLHSPACSNSCVWYRVLSWHFFLLLCANICICYLQQSLHITGKIVRGKYQTWEAEKRFLKSFANPWIPLELLLLLLSFFSLISVTLLYSLLHANWTVFCISNVSSCTHIEFPSTIIIIIVLEMQLTGSCNLANTGHPSKVILFLCSISCGTCVFCRLLWIQ